MEILLFLAGLIVIHALAVMSPGPDFVVSVKNTMQSGRKAGIFTALGFASGCLVHIAYCLLGLAVIISQSVLLFTMVKLLGAGYLMYLGAMALINNRKFEMADTKQRYKALSNFNAWKVGVITNLLNPKATLYFLGVFTLVITPETPAWVLMVAALLIFLVTFVWFSLVALVLTIPRIQTRFISITPLLDKVFGAILVAFGLKLALSSNN